VWRLSSLTSGGSSDEKRHFDPSLFIQSGSTSELNLHDCALHLILTWNLRPIKKHAKLRNIDYWWLDCFKSNRHPDLALILFNDTTKAIGSGMNTNITLLQGTYLPYVLRQLGISTHGDTPIFSNQPISYGALHHAECHFDAASNTWMKHYQSREMKMMMSTLPLMIFWLRTPFLHGLLCRMEDVNSRLSTLDTQMASLLARFPSTPPFSPHHDD
ncbi:hypothetical protein Golob_000789, partial [Gossypium lobatum]|nr:hypothetical protein [Gossypium lobatum]